MTDAHAPADPSQRRPWPRALEGLSIAGSTIPVALLAALPGLVYAAGFDHLAYGLGLLAGIVLAALLIAPRIARAPGATAVAAVGERFGTAAAILAGLVTLLAAVPLLTAELALIGKLGAAGLGGSGILLAVGGAAALVMVAAVALGETALAILSALAWLLLALSFAVPLVLIAARSGGLPFPLFSYGDALKEIVGLEEQLVEGGLVDFDTFSAHLTPFARLAELDIFALVLTLALGIAALPHLAAAIARTARGRAAVRLAGAWTAFFVMIVLVAVPALAAFAKREIYREILTPTSLASLPPWLEAPLRADLATLHGTAPHLLGDVAAAVRAGSTDADAIATALSAASPRAVARWQALDPAVQTALAASAGKLAPGASEQATWDAYREALPSLAAAAGNDRATLTQAALALEPLGLFLALPELAGLPTEAVALMIVAATVAALVLAARMARSVARLLSPGAASRPDARGGALALLAVAAAAACAATYPVDPVPTAVTALAIAGSGLFPVLAVGLAWRRATRAGVLAAMLLGTGMTLYYVAGTTLFPAAFYATWPALSNASDSAREEWNALALDETDAEDAAARAAAAASRDQLARGSASRPGLANWAGIDSASAAVFGAPAALAALILVSLLTRRRPS